MDIYAFFFLKGTVLFFLLYCDLSRVVLHNLPEFLFLQTCSQFCFIRQQVRRAKHK